MAEKMVRKQLYLQKRQNQVLKRLAKQRGISEAEVIRQALEREAQAGIPPLGESSQGWEEIRRFVRERNATYAGKGKPVKWDRASLYEEGEQK